MSSKHPGHEHQPTDAAATVAMILAAVAVAVSLGVVFMSACVTGDTSARLDAIEFYLECPPEHRYVNADGELFCLEVTP